jgi:hypothetical protein
MSAGRRPYRVIYYGVDSQGAPRRCVITIGDFERARRTARSIATDGRGVEVHYVHRNGEHECLEVCEPRDHDQIGAVDTAVINSVPRCSSPTEPTCGPSISPGRDREG